MATVTVTTGEELRQLREDAGLTQADVAREMGSTQQHVSVIEGKAIVRPRVAARYRLAVGVYTSAANPSAREGQAV